MVVMDLDWNRVEGKLKPSSDTPTHLELYKRYAEIGGVVHTHSTEATAWAQAGRSIPLYGTTHADYFYGEIPCARSLTPQEIDEAYEKNTGLVIIETFDSRNLNPMYTPGVLCTNHGPFTWGKDAAEAVHNAVVLEEVAKMALFTEQVNPKVDPAPDCIRDKHFGSTTITKAYIIIASRLSFNLKIMIVSSMLYFFSTWDMICIHIKRSCCLSTTISTTEITFFLKIKSIY